MKILLYGIVSIVVLVLSIIIHRPPSVERPETGSQVTETQKSPPLRRIHSNADADKEESHSGFRDGLKRSGLPEKQKGFVERSETGLEITQAKKSSPLSTIRRGKVENKDLFFEGSDGNDFPSGDSSFDGFGDGGFGEGRFGQGGFGEGGFGEGGFGEGGFGEGGFGEGGFGNEEFGDNIFSNKDNN